MKKVLLIILVVLVMVTGCGKKDKDLTDAEKFKKEYESLNGKKDSKDLEHRNVKIDEDNPYIYISTSDLLYKINNKETFYVYFGDKQCPWCRSVIEKSIEVAKRYEVKTIYYVPIWDDDHNEILRDVYELDGDNKPIIKTEGTEDYYKLLEIFGDNLRDYNLKINDTGKEIKVGKRIYAPNYIYVKDGVTQSVISGYSEDQKDSREELTKELLSDEDKIFSEFFGNK